MENNNTDPTKPSAGPDAPQNSFAIAAANQGDKAANPQPASVKEAKPEVKKGNTKNTGKPKPKILKQD